MHNDYMLSLEGLELDARRKLVLQEYADNAQYLAELYKFVEQEKITELLNRNPRTLDGQFPNAKFQWLASCNDSEIQRDVAAIVIQRGQGKLDVFVRCDEDEDKITKLLLRLWENQVELKWLTKYNWDVLTNGLDASLMNNCKVLFKRIVIDAIERGATDIHFKPRHDGNKLITELKYRIGSDLVQSELFNLTVEQNNALVSSITSSLTDTISLDLIHEKGVSTKIGDVFGDGTVSIRFTANRTTGSAVYLVGRIQQAKTFSFTIDSLGFSDDTQDMLQHITTKRTGLTLITGSIRTGKNTTAFALANEMVKQPINIVSYEAPIEVYMPFTQIEYNGETEGLLNAIRLAKKQDVNIAFLNEIPDKAVAVAVQDLVNSSIHVITTFHLDRLFHLPYKLKEFYGEEYKNVISQINAVINQKMFSKACKECTEVVSCERYQDKLWYGLIKNENNLPSSHGCEACGWTGELKSEVQPYTEYLYFNDRIKSELLKCNEPYEMEAFLKEELKRQGHDFETVLLNAIKSHEILPTGLNMIV